MSYFARISALGVYELLPIRWFIRNLADIKGDLLVSMAQPDQSYEERNFK